jgi:hypothetical protein
MVKSLAVSLTSGENCGLSAASLSKMRTAVTTFVLTPHAMCVLTHMHFCRVTPYLWSNQRSKRLVLNPLLSMAKSFSTVRRGRALCAMRNFRTGVRSAFSKKDAILRPEISRVR